MPQPLPASPISPSPQVQHESFQQEPRLQQVWKEQIIMSCLKGLRSTLRSVDQKSLWGKASRDCCCRAGEG